MKTRYTLISFFTLLFLTGSFIIVSAQDIVFRIDGEQIECKVIELGEDVVVFKPYHPDEDKQADMPEISLNMNLVHKIIFENDFEYAKEDIRLLKVHRYAESYGQAIKVDFLSIIGPASKITYEKAKDYNTSYEFGLIFHGLGLNNSMSSYGLGLEGAYRYRLGGLLASKTAKDVLQGFYINPQLVIGLFGADASRDVYPYRNKAYSTVYLGGTIGGGYQAVFSDVFIIDIFYGEGILMYGNADNTMYSLPIGGGYFSFGYRVTTVGIKLGYAFGEKYGSKNVIKKR